MTANMKDFDPRMLSAISSESLFSTGGTITPSDAAFRLEKRREKREVTQ